MSIPCQTATKTTPCQNLSAQQTVGWTGGSTHGIAKRHHKKEEEIEEESWASASSSSPAASISVSSQEKHNVWVTYIRELFLFSSLQPLFSFTWVAAYQAIKGTLPKSPYSNTAHEHEVLQHNKFIAQNPFCPRGFNGLKCTQKPTDRRALLPTFHNTQNNKNHHEHLHMTDKAHRTHTTSITTL